MRSQSSNAGSHHVCGELFHPLASGKSLPAVYQQLKTSVCMSKLFKQARLPETLAISDSNNHASSWDDIASDRSNMN